MAYNKRKLYEEAMKIIQEKVIFFEKDLISYLPCQETTFYTKFKDSKEMESMKRAIEVNKVKAKANVRHNLYNNADNPTAQIAFYKMIATPEEREALNVRTEVTGKDGGALHIAQGLDLSVLTDEQQEVLLKLGESILMKKE